MDTSTAHSEYKTLLSALRALLSETEEPFIFCDQELFHTFASPQKPIKKEEKPAVFRKPKVVKELISPPSEEPISAPPPKTHLPSQFSHSSIDTESVRKEMAEISGMPHLSSSPIYNSPTQNKTVSISIYTYLSASDDSSRNIFVKNVAEAVSDKLAAKVDLYSCSDPLFTQILPMVCDDSDAIFFFIDQHHEKSLKEFLQKIPGFSEEASKELFPFISMGTLHKKTLFVCLLGNKTHEDLSLKKQLWTALKNTVSNAIKTRHQKDTSRVR